MHVNAPTVCVCVFSSVSGNVCGSKGYTALGTACRVKRELWCRVREREREKGHNLPHVTNVEHVTRERAIKSADQGRSHRIQTDQLLYII